MSTLADRIRTALAQQDSTHGHRPMLQDGDDYWAERSGDMAKSDAAVLVAFIDQPRPAIILTRRTESLRNHSGQVAFPGGRIDASDGAPSAAALREAAEEIALPTHAAQIIGTIPPYRTVTGYCVTPVIAVVPPGLALVASPAEVARIFTVPVDVLFNPANQHERTVDWEGRSRSYHEITYDNERIWGATAAMIRNLGALLGIAHAPEQWNRCPA